ncbi:MAG: hypothetical protein GY723_04635 [bacterium]|nr:hypothetical protein [bacterium]MCP5067380.1 hypothetical protein [bacterium]
MESNPITSRTPAPAVTKAREAGERDQQRRRFDEHRRNAFRRARDDEGGTADLELELSPEARRAEAGHDDEAVHKNDASDSVRDIRGRRLDIRI